MLICIINFEDKHPIFVMNNDHQICLNWKMVYDKDVTEQEFEQFKFYFCTVINQVAHSIHHLHNN